MEMCTGNFNSVFEKIHGGKLYLQIIEKDNSRKPNGFLPPFLHAPRATTFNSFSCSVDISLHIFK